MSRHSRRGIIGIGLAAATGLGFTPTFALNRSPLLLPDTPQILTRRIERSLLNDVWLTIRRSWQVHFMRDGHGIVLTGDQVSVEVDAPASLAPIAAIEESRSTAGMWPIRLGESGLIFAAGNGVRAEDLSAAIDMAEEMIAAKPIPQAEKDVQREHLASMQKAGSNLLDRLPDDLFFPTVGPMRAVRSVELPGGMTGEFELSYAAHAVPGSGWLDWAERSIVTRLAGTEHIAREFWQLRRA